MKKKVVAFVPLRMNSKRVPGKNLKLLGGKPLYAWIIETLLQVSSIDDVYVFCSDVSLRSELPHGVKFLNRSRDLDSDSTKGLAIYNAFMREVDADIYLLAHATSPFLRVETAQECVEAVLGDYDSAFTVRAEQTFAWYGVEPLNYCLDDVVRTQELQPVYFETSAVYAYKAEVLQNLQRRIGDNPKMIITKGEEAIDIDQPEDFELAEAYAQLKLGCS